MMRAGDPNVACLTTRDAAGNPVQFTVGTDIVDHVESARTFGLEQLADPAKHGRFQRRVLSLPDRRGPVVCPMLLTLSSHGGLYLLRHDGTSGAGWRSTDLLPRRAGLVRAVGAAVTPDDRIAIAVAVDDAPPGSATGRATGSRVLVAYDLSTRTSDWSAIPWRDLGTRPIDPPSDRHVSVAAIRVLDAGDGTWTVVLAGAGGTNDTVHLLRSADPTRTFASALVLDPAETLDELLDFEAGVHPCLGPGLYVLGNDGGGEPLLHFRPFPTYGPTGTMAEVPPAVLLPVAAGSNVLETGMTTPEGTDLYVAGEGVVLIRAVDQEDADAAPVRPVMGPGAAPMVDLVVTEGDGPTTAWTLGADGALTVVSRVADDAWGSPLRLRSGVVEIAPVGPDLHQTASLVTVRGDGSAAQLWRDAASGSWVESPILVADPQEVTATTCYGTVVRVLDADGLPRPGMSVRVSASTLSNVVVNGTAAHLGPRIEIDATTDANGAVCIYDRVRSLMPATYRFTFVELGRALDVNPASAVHQRLATVTAADLRDASTTSLQGHSAPLLDDEFRTGPRAPDVAALATALNRAAGLATRADGPAAGIQLVDAEGMPLVATPLVPRPAPGAGRGPIRWGMQAGPGGVTVLDHRDATTLGSAPAQSGGALHDLGDTLADFFEGLISGAAQALRVVVQAAEDAWEFVCEIAGTVWRWTLDTLEQAGAFFTWLWEQVRTTLEQVWEWLKFVVDWQDILRVRNAMVDATDQAMRFMTHEVVSLRRSVDEGFTAFERQIAQWVGRTESSGGPSPGAGASAAGDAIRQVTSTAGDILHMATGNSAVAWVLQRLGGVADEIVRIEGPSPFDTVPDALGGFLTDLIADEAVVILDCITRMGRDLVEHVGGSAPGAHDLSWQALGDIAATIGGDVLQALVEAVRTIVVRALDLLVGIMQALHDALFVRVEFPFVERLAALVGWDLDTSFRFIDALMLLAAVPATITYKIAFGRAPLREGDVLELPFGSPQAQSQGHPWWWALLGLMGAFLKLAVAVHRTWEALKQVAGIAVPQTRIGQVLGTLFAVVGWVVEVLAMHSERGAAVTGIESAMVAVTGVSVLVALSLMVWEKSRGDVDLAARRAVAGVDAALTIVHLGLKAADFAILVQHPTEDEDTASESVAFTESALSHVAVVLLDGARLVDEPETQLALTAAASLCRSEAFSLGVVRVVGSHST